MDELIGFLSDSKPEVRLIAVSNLVTIEPGQFSEKQLRDMVEALSRRLAGSYDFTKVALSLLINLCGEKEIVMDTLLNRKTIGSVCALVSDAETPEDVVELAAMLLANMTRTAAAVLQLLEVDSEFAGRRFLALVAKFLSSKEKTEERDPFGWLALVLQNCSQVVDARRFLLDKNRSVMTHLSDALRRFKTTRRRRGIAATIRNCLLETEHHSWLVEPPVNIVQSILIGLVSSKGNFSDDEKRAMPPDVREAVFDPTQEVERGIYDLFIYLFLVVFLSPLFFLKVEKDDETRCSLVESVVAICFHGVIAERLKLWSGYAIIRELERFERCEQVIIEIHSAIDLLVREHDDFLRQRRLAAAPVTANAAAPPVAKTTAELQKEILDIVEEEKQLAKCANCGKTENLARCTGCFAVSFCGRTCQVANWKVHKERCLEIQERNKKWDEEDGM